ncbi:MULTISPECIES: hypothetical protein [unclassified Streptomyces]|uniref:hypothetical protein n=1 Tax=unclassified Streptomyces TaxID=2593676 RepID=UPI0016607BBE|nr:MULTISPECIES: hypothetical protein [unclassified Streptomyces]MBD0707392.1 hypothetical protein [Streptomyces sp. CBMA291]MBD0715156.1 hypothetical protein [Streptomyces sp. CBMA370]
MTTTSRVPAAVNAFLDILRGSPTLSNVRVVDGPPAVNLSDRRILYVGWQPDTQMAVTLEQDFNAAGARSRDETFVIAGYIEARGGEKTMSVRRAEAFDILSAVETALRATDAAPTAPTLNGTVLWAHLTAGDLSQQQTSSGALAGLNFALSCHARI